MPITPSQKIIAVALAIAASTVGISFLGYQIYVAAKSGPIKNNWKDYASKTSELDAEIKLLTQKIKSRQGQRKCKSDSDCKIVGLGAKICDGYSDFLVYSTLDTDEDGLLNTVQVFNSKLTEFLELSFKVPSCGTKPRGATCVRAVCQSN